MRNRLLERCPASSCCILVRVRGALAAQGTRTFLSVASNRFSISRSKSGRNGRILQLQLSPSRRLRLRLSPSRRLRFWFRITASSAPRLDRAAEAPSQGGAPRAECSWQEPQRRAGRRDPGGDAPHAPGIEMSRATGVWFQVMVEMAEPGQTAECVSHPFHRILSTIEVARVVCCNLGRIIVVLHCGCWLEKMVKPSLLPEIVR